MAVSIRCAYSLEIAALALLSILPNDYNDLVRGSAPVALERRLDHPGAGNRSTFTVPLSQPAVHYSSGDDLSPRRTRSSPEIHNIAWLPIDDRETVRLRR
jgi:hypothetical protein